MEIRAAEISSILKDQIANFGAEADVAEVMVSVTRGEIDLDHVLGRAVPVRFRLIAEHREGQRLRTGTGPLQREDVSGLLQGRDTQVRAVSAVSAARRGS